eukprot:296207_1
MEDVFAKLNKTAETSGLEKSVTELKTELESFKMKNKRLETENEWWKSEKQQVLTGKENECRELKENIVSTQARHSVAIERTQSELATASKENERLVSENELFRAQLVEKEKINSELVSKNLAATQSRHSEATERTQSELATASKENERLVSENELFRAQLVEKEKINSELVSKNLASTQSCHSEAMKR